MFLHIFSQQEMRTLKKRVSQFMSHCDELIQFSSPSVQRVVSKEIAFFSLNSRLGLKSTEVVYHWPKKTGDFCLNVQYLVRQSWLDWLDDFQNKWNILKGTKKFLMQNIRMENVLTICSSSLLSWNITYPNRTYHQAFLLTICTKRWQSGFSKGQLMDWI